MTDDMINLLAGERVLTNYEDKDKNTSYLNPAIGGFLDKYIFGSCFSNQCNCGDIHKITNVPCPRCGSKILTEEESWTRFAKIELPIFYCNGLKKKQFLKFIRESDLKIRTQITDKTAQIIKEGNPFFAWDFCQFNWDEEKEEIICTDDITDFNKCSFEGLLMIIIDHYPHLLQEYKSFINTNVLVIPLIARASYWTYRDGKRTLVNHEISIMYRTILWILNKEYDKAMDMYQSQLEKSLYRANFREYVASVVEMSCTLLRPSKENFSRTMQSQRISNSGRCTIIPAPELQIDEVKVPRHLMYECCRDEFINFMIQDQGWSEVVARTKYLTEARTDEVQGLFDRYINEANGGKGKYVVINRNPTLYELGMMACKVKLTNDYTMGLPLLLCSPFGGDYDGDTFSFYTIPDAKTDEIVSKMSPRNITYYKKNQSPLFTPSHEIMGGIITGTKKMYSTKNIFTNCDKVEERKVDNEHSVFIPSFDTYEEAYQCKRKTKGFKWLTVINIAGEETTLGIYKFSELFKRDINEFLRYEIERKPNRPQHITSSDIPELYNTINQEEDRLERIHDVQEFALLIATTSGATAPTLSELHANLPAEYLERIHEVENSDILSDREKDVKIRNIYDAYMKEVEFGKDEEGNLRVSESLKLKISDSSRAKINQLLNIITPQLTVGPDHIAHVTTTRLINGMNPTDYTRHSIENRGTQDIKVSATPRSGYTTRQLVFLGKGFYYSEELDPKNSGISIELKKAAGRTRIDGSIISKSEADNAKSDEFVTVRSIITSKYTDRCIVTKDCVSNLNTWVQGDNIGVSLLSSLTEGLTQSGLSLKHGGRLYETDKKAGIIAPIDCTLQITDNFIVLKGEETYVYPRSTEFVQNYVDDNKYKKGDLVGVVYRQFTPSYRLDCVIKLIGAAGSNSRKKAINNKVLITECYAYGPGKIHYVVEDKSIVRVEIGDYSYSYDPDACYFIPEGAHVEFGQRFCTGTVNMPQALKVLKDRVLAFRLFYNQFNELIPGIAPELIEFVYSLIVLQRNGKIVNKTVLTATLESPGFLNKISLRNSRRILEAIPKEGIEFISDATSDIFLPTLSAIDLYM